MASLICKLKRHAITEDGDFIPAGTPVEVMGWTGNGTADAERTPAERRKMIQRPTIAVRTGAYMYAGEFDCDARQAAVGRGLFIDVEPSNLVYVEYDEQ